MAELFETNRFHPVKVWKNKTLKIHFSSNLDCSSAMPSSQERQVLIDKYMRDKLGLRAPVRAAVIYYAGQFWEQVLAVVPITM